MAITNEQLAVSTTAVAVASGNAQVGDDVHVYLRNEGANSVYLGDADVTDGTGAELKINEATNLVLSSGDDLYAICAAAESATLHILRTRQPS